jgi:hypothetical protein
MRKLGDFRSKNGKVRVSESDKIEKKYVFYEKDRESESFLEENIDEFHESEGFMLFYGKR